MTLSPLSRGIEQALSKLDLHSEIPLTDNISLDPAKFYDELGHLKHPRTGQEVTHLADYQIEVWNTLHKYKRVLAVKSNKIGLTTSALMMDFQLALLPTSNQLSTRGYDTLLIGQTIQHAKEHLYTLRKMILSSEKYGKYLVTKPTELVLRDEVTKVTVLFIRNPENEKQPSRIIGLGLSNAGSLLSWKNVKHIHMSDPTAAEGDYSEAVNAAMTRLANTNGSMIIETIPSGPEGRVYDLYRQYEGKEYEAGDFKVMTITAEQAVKAGVITREFLDGELDRLGPMYGRYYSADFTQGQGNIFNNHDIDLCITHYDLSFKDGYKILTADPAFSKSGSKFGLLGIEVLDGVAYVKECQIYQGASTSEMIDTVQKIYLRDSYDILKVDSAYPGLISDWQVGNDSRYGINAVPFSFREKAQTSVVNSAQKVNQLKLRIHPEFAELVRQMRTCRYDSTGKLDKSRDSFDLIDCLSMALDDGGGAVGWVYLPSGKGRGY